MQKIVFIAGQSGAGKTTLVKYFKDHPVAGWIFFDFDEGGHKKPKDESKINEWVQKQRQFWLKEVYNSNYQDKNIVVLGVGIFSWQLNLPGKVYYGYLSCNQEIRKSRLVGRGDVHLFDEQNPSMDQVVKKLKKEGVKRIDAGQPIEKVAGDIKKWIRNIC